MYVLIFCFKLCISLNTLSPLSKQRERTEGGGDGTKKRWICRSMGVQSCNEKKAFLKKGSFVGGAGVNEGSVPKKKKAKSGGGGWKQNTEEIIVVNAAPVGLWI